MSDDFSFRIDLPAPAEEVYAQLATRTGVCNWWTPVCEMEERVGGRLSCHFPGSGFYAEMKVTALEPPRLVEWKVLEQEHSKDTGWSDLHDWVGTTIRFEIEPKDGAESALHFTHVGLGPLECSETCSSAWRYYLGESLHALLQDGKGKPYQPQ